MSFTAIALFLVLCFGILTVWVPGLWAQGICQITVFSLALAAVVQAIRGRTSVTPSAWFPLLALGLVPLIGAIQFWTGASSYPWTTLVKTLAWVAIVCIFGLVCTLREAEARTFRDAMLWFSFALAVGATLQYFTTRGKVFWLFELPGETGMGPFPNRNHWAAFIELALPVAMYQLATNRRNAWLYALMIGTMYASSIAGASRAGAILCTVALLVVPLMLRSRGFRADGFAAMMVGVLALTGILTWIVGPGVVWARLMEPDQYVLRREFLLSSFAMFGEHPWSGFGIGTWAVVYPQFAIFDPGVHANEAHNEWAQWAVEGGVPLLAVMLGVTGWVFWRVRRFPWAFGLLLVLLHSWVEYPFERQALACWFAALAGLLATAKK